MPLLLLGILLASLLPAAVSTSSPQNQGLTFVLTSVPPTLPADGQVYGSLVVSLENASRLPAVAPANISVYLSSDSPSIASVSSQVTIQEGRTFAVAQITTSSTPGSSNITATSPGLRTASVLIRTVVPSGFPDHLAVFVVPPVQLAEPTPIQGQVVVQVEDDLGIPARTSSPLTVSVTSSDSAVANVSSARLVIPAQQSVGYEDYQTGLVTGSSSITVSAAGFASGSSGLQVVRPPPLVLKVTTEPNLIAPGSTGRLVVSLLDQNGDPAEAPADIQVFLTSSNLSLAVIAGTVGLNPVELTIPRNQVYAETTFTSGSIGKTNTTITASAHGLVTGFAQVSVKPIEPATVLRLFLAPNPVPSDGKSTLAIGIGLGAPKNSTLFPSEAGSTFPVVVTASDNATGKVIESVTVTFARGTSYAVAEFNSTLLPSVTTITASAQDLSPAQALMATLNPDLPIGAPPSSAAITPVLSSLPADGNQYEALVVRLQDRSGDPAIAPTAISVQLSLNRSDLVQLGAANGVVTIPAGRGYVIVNATTFAVQGIANVTAESTGLASSWTLLKTTALSPERLALYVSPSSTLLPPVGPAALLAVQLQDSAGNPASARADTTITLSSSNTSLISEPLPITIPAHADFNLVYLNATTRGTAVLTAISPGLQSSEVSFTYSRVATGVFLYANPLTVYPNQTVTLTADVYFMSRPLQNATVIWHVTDGTVAQDSTLTGATGSSSVIATPTGTGAMSVYATISSPYFAPLNSSNAQSIVLNYPTPPAKPNLLQQILGNHLYLGGIAAAVVLVAIIVIVLLRRRGREEVEDEGFDIGAAPGEGTAFDMRDGKFPLF